MKSYLIFEERLRRLLSVSKSKWKDLYKVFEIGYNVHITVQGICGILVSNK